NFPTTPGAFDQQRPGGDDGYVTHLAASGAALVYSTYLGGTGIDKSYAISVDAIGSAYVTGFTQSADFPVTPGAFDTSYNAGQDVYVTKFNPAGTGLVYSTFLGGTHAEQGLGLAVDASGAAYISGQTESHDFPTTPGAYDP